MKKILHIRIAGFTLIEALIAALVVGVGMLGLAKLQGELFISSSESRMRTHALNLAQDKIEEFRRVANQDSYVNFASCPAPCAELPIAGSSANFYRSWTITDKWTDPTTCTTESKCGKYKQISVTVTWTDSKSAIQNVKLTSNVAAAGPVKSGVFLASQSTTTTAPTASTTTTTAEPTTTTTETPTTTTEPTTTTTTASTTTTTTLAGACSGLVNTAIITGDILSSSTLLTPFPLSSNIKLEFALNITPKPLSVCVVLVPPLLFVKGTYICTITGLPPDIVNINIGGNTIATSVNVALSDVLPSSLLILLAPVQTLLNLPPDLVCAKAKVNLPITINSQLQVIVPKP